MSADAGSERWFSQRTGLTTLAAVSGALGLLVMLPYLQYVLLGIVLAYIFWPAQRRLRRYVGSMLAALTLVAVAILAILLPVAYVLAIALREALQLIEAVQNDALNVEAIEQQFEKTGYSVDFVAVYETYQDPIASGLQGLGTGAIEFVAGLPGILIGLTVTVFVLFALLRDGEALVAWIHDVLPLRPALQRELTRKFDQLMWASVVGNVAVAAIQAVALGIGLLLLGVPAVVFLTVATFVLALLPLVGAFGVWIPVTVYLAALGDLTAAGLLVVYGSLVSASDTYLRPALIGRTSAFNSAIVVIGIFGGIVVFGAVGLFIGPVVLGGAKLTLDVFAREREFAQLESGQLTAADPAIDTDPTTGLEPAVDTDEPAEESAGDDDTTEDATTGDAEDT